MYGIKRVPFYFRLFRMKIQLHLRIFFFLIYFINSVIKSKCTIIELENSLNLGDCNKNHIEYIE